MSTSFWFLSCSAVFTSWSLTLSSVCPPVCCGVEDGEFEIFSSTNSCVLMPNVRLQWEWSVKNQTHKMLKLELHKELQGATGSSRCRGSAPRVGNLFAQPNSDRSSFRTGLASNRWPCFVEKSCVKKVFTVIENVLTCCTFLNKIAHHKLNRLRRKPGDQIVLLHHRSLGV